MRHDKVGWPGSAFAKALAAISFLLLWGCASGPNLVSMESLLKPPQVGQGRIYIYRESAFGVAVQPQVFLNGEPVGRATPGGVYLVDRPPGRYSVSVQTEAESTASFELAAGQAQYVRLDISMGVLVARVKPVVVDPQVGASEAGKLSLLDSRTATPVGSPTSHASQKLRKTLSPTLSRTEIEGMMRERWYLTRQEDGDRLMWEFSGSRVYGTNLTTPGRISGDWRFNDRGDLCFYWDTRRVIDRCVFFAGQGGRLVLLDASTEAVVHTLERPVKMPSTSYRGSSVNKRNLCSKTPETRILEVDAAVVEAARKGDAAMVRFALKQGIDPNGTTAEGFSLLHIAITENQDQVLELLLQSRADVNMPFMGSSPLALVGASNRAGYPSDKDRARQLIAAGATPTDFDLALETLGKYGFDSYEAGFIDSMKRGDMERLDVYVRATYDINAALAEGIPPLHLAASVGSADSVRFLVKCGADVNARTKRGAPVMAFAKERPEIRQLLASLGAAD